MILAPKRSLFVECLTNRMHLSLTIAYKFSHWSHCSHDSWSIALLDGYSDGQEEKGFGMLITIDVVDFVPQIFKDEAWPNTQFEVNPRLKNVLVS